MQLNEPVAVVCSHFSKSAIREDLQSTRDENRKTAVRPQQGAGRQ